MSHAQARRSIPSTPFEDSTAYMRRWGRYEPGDPVRPEDLPVFIADHIPLADRREGSIAFFTDDTGGRQQLLAIVHDGPAEPTDEDCLMQVAGYLTRVAGGDEAADFTDLGFGLVLHRRGTSVVTDLDRRWRRAADGAAEALGLRVLGVLARTWSGALVTVGPEAAPSPPLNGELWLNKSDK